MQSYVEQAIQTYCSNIILNYHNHFGDEAEEIFDELSGLVLHRINNSDMKIVWGTANVNDLINEGIFYSFSEGKLLPTKPALRVVGESPHVLRAIRTALSMALENMLETYSNQVQICANELGRD